jgi:hypothetical protein
MVVIDNLRGGTKVRGEPYIRAIAYAWIIGVGVFVFSGGGTDAHAYWAADYADPYAHGVVSTDDAYLYSPAFLQALFPLKLLPWEAFWAVWVIGMLAGIVWLARPYVAALAVIPLEENPVFTELWYGNIVVLLAVMLVLGLRYSPWWGVGLLTKVTPGVGVLWFLGRREWRNLGIALAVTVGVVAVSALHSPQAWVEWGELLYANASAPAVDGDVRLPPLPYRLAIAAGLVLVAGWRGWPLLLPPALILALPVFWFATLTLLLAWFRLVNLELDVEPPTTEVHRRR